MISVFLIDKKATLKNGSLRQLYDSTHKLNITK